jgi:hypothetical protein
MSAMYVIVFPILERHSILPLVDRPLLNEYELQDTVTPRAIVALNTTDILL